MKELTRASASAALPNWMKSCRARLKDIVAQKSEVPWGNGLSAGSCNAINEELTQAETEMELALASGICGDMLASLQLDSKKVTRILTTPHMGIAIVPLKQALVDFGAKRGIRPNASDQALHHGLCRLLGNFPESLGDPKP